MENIILNLLSLGKLFLSHSVLYLYYHKTVHTVWGIFQTSFLPGEIIFFLKYMQLSLFMKHFLEV